jgi:DNA polymerase-1
MAKQERLVVIDAHALIHRAYHAIPPLTTKDGEVVNAVYGFAMILLNVLRELKPKYVAVAFDLPGKTKRHEHFEAYKANRVSAPDDLISQFGRVRELVSAFNIPIYQKEGYEADDVIGTIVKKVPDGIESIIVTGDMDELQLVDKKTKVYTMRRGFTDTTIYDEAAVKERYNLTPSQFVDYKALRGDPSDNIPGVAGIGEKTASDLISTYGSLDAVYKNLDKLKPALAEKLKDSKDIAYLSQKLSKLVCNLPIKVILDKCLLHDFDRNRVFDLFQELGFKSLLPRLPKTGEDKIIGGDRVENVKKTDRRHLNTAKYHLINDEKSLEKLCAELAKKKVIAFDTETDSLNEIDANLVGMSFSFKEGEAYYIPVGHNKGVQLGKEFVITSLRPILENPKIGKVGQNIKYDYIVMKNAGINVNPIVFDTMVGAYLINPNARARKLDELAFSELGIEMVPIEELIGKGKEQISFADVELEKARVYASEDADITFRLYKHLSTDLNKSDLLTLMSNIEAPLISILAEMEYAGIKIDSKILNKISKETEKRIETLKNSIWKKAGGEFNIASPAQLQDILFNKLKLDEKVEDPKELKKLKTGGISTSASELEKLRHIDPIVAEIFEYRELTKLKNTYIDVLPKLVNAKTGRIHTSFNQAITQTGRLSSSDPNLQNIPIRTDEGKKIRAAFVADSGNVLLSADYSQIELRVIAHIAKDAEMIKIFEAGRDIHTETAMKVYDVPEKKVTAKMRRVAKIINFGIIYGVSAHGLKQQTGVSYSEGQELIKKYFEIHPAIKEYSDKMIAEAHELGYVETLFGRRRYLPEIKSSNFAVRGAAERMAINMPVQGSAADLLKLAMIDIALDLHTVSPNTKMLLQVHDELVFETPTADAEKVARFVKEKMDNVVKLSVPIETSVSYGNNWSKAKD